MGVFLSKVHLVIHSTKLLDETWVAIFVRISTYNLNMHERLHYIVTIIIYKNKSGC